MIVLESLYKFRTGESDKLKTVLESYDMENSSKDIDAQFSEVEDDGEEKHTLPQNMYAELILAKKTVAAKQNNSEKLETVTA